MGILNITPDSFYDRGRYSARDSALARALELAEQGADLIDVGGEKAGPGVPVSVEEEKHRVVDIIDRIAKELRLPVSVDSFKPEVARAAMEAGASIINSIGGFEDPEMRRVARETDAAIVIMHIQGQPRVDHPTPRYGDVVAEVRDFLMERAGLCAADGIGPDRIIIDPGPGFGKSPKHDIALMGNLDMLTALPYPVLLAASRKEFIGDILDLDVDSRLEGSLAVVAWGVMCGVKMVRVHDVRAAKRVCKMMEAVLGRSDE
jgi:dihydropteroate synthase